MNDSKVRLFFALWPDEATRRALAAWQLALHEQCGGRALHVDDVHLTLAFLGDTPTSQLTAARGLLDEIHTSVFALRIDRVQYWRHNKIVWAGPSAPVSELTHIVERLRGGLGREGIRFDAKAFSPHITLLRKANAPTVAPTWAPIEWTVDRVALIRPSGSTGPRYRVDAERLLSSG